ncbi:MAG: uroporphyrinogen-III synthase [Candidatus Cohnella colombiensis]|uniref:Uroporphyrinogen-III synthase n=1 Tax=Candidatus Cohnella colombiensis TaxID=3121368 RepID=A0AA95EZD6_9BACL|nr:MAG: uroporphyrinogen-III synthase [Cohnella sp.]
MGKLDGVHIAVTGPRCEVEFTRIVTKMGGQPSIAPAQGITYMDAKQLQVQIEELIRHRVDWLLLTTGIGTTALLDQADELGLKDQLLTVMKQTPIAARGYKTLNVLRKLEITPTIIAEDGTTEGLFKALSAYPLEGAKLALQLYGDPSPKLTERLRQSGAQCIELLPYIHIMPDRGPIDLLIGQCLDGTMDAVLFTSTAQARCVLQRARELNVDQQLLETFDKSVLGVAVGRVTAEAMREEGITRVLFPEEERLGSALLSAGRWFEERRST